MDRFQTSKSFLRAMVFDPSADRAFVDELWNAPDALVDGSEKLTNKQCVRTTVRLQRDEEIYVVKRHLERSWRHFVKQCFTRSRAEKCWNDTWYLVACGYPTPKPIAYLENRLGPLRGNSYYAYQFVHGQTFKQAATNLKNQRVLREYVNQLVNIWCLHRELRINLNDGHPANFIIDATGKMWVIDLDKLKRLHGNGSIDEQLLKTFEQALRGVIGDYRIIDYGMRKLADVFQDVKCSAA